MQKKKPNPQSGWLSHLITCSTLMSYSPWTFFPRKALALQEKKGDGNQEYISVISNTERSPYFLHTEILLHPFVSNIPLHTVL